MKKWSDLIDRNASLRERIEQAKLDEHISTAIKYRDDYMDRPVDFKSSIAEF